MNRATLHRWATDGLKGVRLEVIRIGGTTCTSKSALQRFFNALTAIEDRNDDVELDSGDNKRDEAD